MNVETLEKPIELFGYLNPTKSNYHDEIGDMILRGFIQRGFRYQSFKQLQDEINSKFVKYYEEFNGDFLSAFEKVDDDYDNLVSLYDAKCQSFIASPLFVIKK